MKHIGIVGCSSEGAALCYRTVCLEAENAMGRHGHPEVTLHTICLADYNTCFQPQENWDKVAEMMLRSANALKRAGADFLICPDNTIHQALPRVLPSSPLPWLHIAEEVAKEAKRKGSRKLGITGTKFLVRGPVYPDKLKPLGIDWVRPTEAQQQLVNRIIFDELVRGQLRAESLCHFEKVMESLRDQGCDAVVLGCTELPLLVGLANGTPVPTLDSTRILARAALREAMS